MSDGPAEGAFGPEAPESPAGPPSALDAPGGRRGFRDGRLFRLLVRPPIAFGLMLILFRVLFPRFGTRDLDLSYQLPAARCATDLVISAWGEDGRLARRSTWSLEGRRTLEQVMNLPAGDYRVTVELRCADGRSELAAERAVALLEPASQTFDLEGGCPCPAAAAGRAEVGSGADLPAGLPR